MLKIIVFSLFTFLFLFSSTPSLAIEPIGVRQPKANSGVLVNSNCKPDTYIGRVIDASVQIFFLIGAIGVLIMFLWGAVDWILSGGDKEKVAGARKRITTALMGIALLALTFIAVYTIGTMIGINPLAKFDIPTFTGQSTKTDCNALPANQMPTFNDTFTP
jgi:hypothetical protein